MADDTIVTVDDSPSVTPAPIGRNVINDTSCIDLTHDDDDAPQEPQEPPRRRPRLNPNANQANIELVDLTQTPPTVPMDIRSHFPVVEERSVRYSGHREQLGPSIGGLVGPSIGSFVGPSIGSLVGPSIGGLVVPSMGVPVGPSIEGPRRGSQTVRRSPRKRRFNAGNSAANSAENSTGNLAVDVPRADDADGAANVSGAASVLPNDGAGTSASPAPSGNSDESLPSVAHIVQSIVDENKKLAEQDAKKKGPPSPQKQISCPICFDELEQLRAEGRQLMSGNCGHVFCCDCIKAHLKIQSFCPQCRKRLTVKSIHPLYL